MYFAQVDYGWHCEFPTCKRGACFSGDGESSPVIWAVVLVFLQKQTEREGLAVMGSPRPQTGKVLEVSGEGRRWLHLSFSFTLSPSPMTHPALEADGTELCRTITHHAQEKCPVRGILTSCVPAPQKKPYDSILHHAAFSLPPKSEPKHRPANKVSPLLTLLRLYNG